MRTSDLLTKLANALDSSDNEIIVRASDDVMPVVANALVSASDILRQAAEIVNDYGPDETELEEMAAIASEFDSSGDPWLQKQASVIDEILLSVGSEREAMTRFKQAQDAEINRLRQKYRTQQREAVYNEANEQHHKEYNMAGEGTVEAAISKRVKEYRPLEAPLSTRYCPEHAGEQLMRVADSVYQCQLDKQIYNYEAGYTTMAGNQIPGTGVSNQTQHLGFQAQEHSNFGSREEVLNNK